MHIKGEEALNDFSRTAGVMRSPASNLQTEQGWHRFPVTQALHSIRSLNLTLNLACWLIRRCRPQTPEAPQERVVCRVTAREHSHTEVIQRDKRTRLPNGRRLRALRLHGRAQLQLRRQRSCHSPTRTLRAALTRRHRRQNGNALRWRPLWRHR